MLYIVTITYCLIVRDGEREFLLLYNNNLREWTKKHDLFSDEALFYSNENLIIYTVK